MEISHRLKCELLLAACAKALASEQKQAVIDRKNIKDFLLDIRKKHNAIQQEIPGASKPSS